MVVLYQVSLIFYSQQARPSVLSRNSHDPESQLLCSSCGKRPSLRGRRGRHRQGFRDNSGISTDGTRRLSAKKYMSEILVLTFVVLAEAVLEFLQSFSLLFCCYRGVSTSPTQLMLS